MDVDMKSAINYAGTIRYIFNCSVLNMHLYTL